MEVFLLWFAGALVILAGYLSLLWWRPDLPFIKSKKGKSGRFQARLTILFLLFALVPAVPLVFLVSALYTRSMEILLVPKIQESLSQGLDAIKFQLEERARLFEHATRSIAPTPELLAQWKIDFCLLWRRDSANVRPSAVVGLDLLSRQRAFGFAADQIVEVWGQTGSQLQTAPRNGDAATINYCCVWLPRLPNTPTSDGSPQKIVEMLVVGFQVDTYLLQAKQNLTEASRVYNSLALLKESLLRDKILWSAAALLIMLLSAFSVYAARRFSQTLSRPIESLTATMGEVAGGNLTVRADIPARDEIRVLVDSFNRMIEDLRGSREKLIVSERMAAWREVARQVSHEIKNPLTALQLALYRLRQRLSAIETIGGDATVAKESFQSIDDELAGLRHLAEEFSDFARLPKAELLPGSINEVVQMTARLHEVSGPERIQIHFDLDAELPPRPIDRGQIKRALNNLLKNALEAAANRPCEIRIKTRRQNERAILEIADNGPGLSPEARAHLFEPNFTTKREGSGLGLVMIKRIIEEHGGSIEVESETGKGTLFRIVI